MTYCCIPIPSFAVWEEQVFDVVLELCVSLVKNGCVARDSTQGHVARPGIWFGPDTRSRALKSVLSALSRVHVVVWSKLGSGSVVSRRARGGGTKGPKTHRQTHTDSKALASLATYRTARSTGGNRKTRRERRWLQHGRAASQARSLRGSCFPHASRTHTGGGALGARNCMRCCCGTSSRFVAAASAGMCMDERCSDGCVFKSDALLSSA